MNIQKGISIALVLLFFTGVANANLLGLEQGWPLLVDNNTKIKGKIRGNTVFFDAENKKSKRNAPYFKEAPEVPRVHFSDVKFKTWADIRLTDAGPEVLDGEFAVYGSLDLGNGANKGLAFSASLLDVAWDNYTIGFKMGADQHGYLCDLGFCSFANELLSFNITSFKFDDDSEKNFSMKAQTVATVPIPPAVWMFGTAMLGLVIRRPNQVAESFIS